MWFETIKKKETFPRQNRPPNKKDSEISDGRGGTRTVSLDDRFGRGRRLISPKGEKGSPRETRKGVEGLYDYISENSGSPYDRDFKNQEWDEAIKELDNINKEYGVNLKNANILELIKTDSEEGNYELAIERINKNQKEELLKKIKKNFVKKSKSKQGQGNISFTEKAADRYDLEWRVSKNAASKMNYTVGTMFTEIEGESDFVYPVGASARPYTKGLDNYIARTFGTRLGLLTQKDMGSAKILVDGILKTLLEEIKEEMTSEDKKEIGELAEYEKFLDDKGNLKKSQINSQMKYKPIGLLDEEGYVFEKRHQQKIQSWYKKIENLKKHFISRESKSYTDEYKNKTGNDKEDKYVFIGSKKRIKKVKNKKPKEEMYGGILVEKETGLPVLDKDAKEVFKKLQSENPLQTLFEGDTKVKNVALGAVKIYALLYGDELDLQKTKIKSVKQKGLLRNILERAKRIKERSKKESSLSAEGLEKEVEIFRKILEEGAKNKFVLARKNKDKMILLAPKIADFLGGLRNNLSKGIKNLIVEPNAKFPFDFEDYIGYSANVGGDSLTILESVFYDLKINFDIEKLTSKDLKNILEGLNFDFNNFTKKIISAYEDEEDNMMNILESGRPTIDDEKFIRDVKLDLFFGDKYRKQRLNSAYEILIEIDELEDDLTNGDIEIDSNMIKTITSTINTVNLLIAIIENDNDIIDTDAESNYEKALKKINEKTGNKIKVKEVDKEKIKRLNEMFDDLDTEREQFRQEKENDELQVDEKDLGEMIEKTEELLDNFQLDVIYDVEYTYLKTSSVVKKSYPLPKHIKRRIKEDTKNIKNEEERKKKAQELAMRYYDNKYPNLTPPVRPLTEEKYRAERAIEQSLKPRKVGRSDWKDTVRKPSGDLYQVKPRTGKTVLKPAEGTMGFPRRKVSTNLDDRTSFVDKRERVTEKIKVKVKLSYSDLSNNTSMQSQFIFESKVKPEAEKILRKKYAIGDDNTGKPIPLKQSPQKITITDNYSMQSNESSPLFKEIRRTKRKLNSIDKELDGARKEVSQLKVGIKYLQFLTNQLPDELNPPNISNIKDISRKPDYNLTYKTYQEKMKEASDWLDKNLTFGKNNKLINNR